MAQKWYNLTPEQVAGRMKTDINNGLTKKEAKHRLQREGKNNVYRSSFRASAGRLLKQVVLDPCALLLMLCAILAGFFGVQVAQDAIVTIIIINWICVFFAYITARMIMANSSESTIPTATVCRDGKLYKIKQTNICHGDIIILEKGDVVPADARLIYADKLTLLEASLTGDVRIKHKTVATIPGAGISPRMQSNMVFATTIVADGSARAVVCETGDDTLAVIMQRNIELTSNNSLSSIGSLRRYCTHRSMAILSVVFVLCLINLIFNFSGTGVFGVFISGLCLVCAAMCEYSTIFGYIIVGSGLFNTLKSSKEDNSASVVKNTATIENLSEVTTVIVPKNGAFTSNSVHINSLFCDLVSISPEENKLGVTCRNLISCALDSTAYGENGYACLSNFSKARYITDEDKAIFGLAEKSGVFDSVYTSNHVMLEHIETAGISPKCFSLVKFPTSTKLLVRGDLSYVLPKCSYIRGVEKTGITNADIYKIKEAAKEATNEGCSVIAIASSTTSAKTVEEAKKEKRWIFEGFITINETGLCGTFDNVKRLKDAGVKVIMLSSDTGLATRMYAKTVGIISNEQTDVSTVQLPRSAKSQMLRKDNTPYSLYEGLNATQVSMLIDALHDNKEVVGYFGTDFNDIALLKQADVGFSSGVTLRSNNASLDLGFRKPTDARVSDKQCNEALKLICDVIVSPIEKKGGGFNAVVKSIAQSRTVFLNILSSNRYITATQYARMTLVFLSIVMSTLLFGTGSLIQPVQILFTGLICDFAMIVSIASVLPERKIPKKDEFNTDFSKPLSKNKRSVVIGIIWALLTVGVLGLIKALGFETTDNQLATVAFYGFILTQLIICTESFYAQPIIAKRPHKNFPLFICALSSLGFIILTQLITPIGSLFSIARLSLPMLALVLLIPILMFIVFELFKRYSIFENAQVQEEQKEEEKEPVTVADINKEQIRNKKSKTVNTDWIEEALKFMEDDDIPAEEEKEAEKLQVSAVEINEKEETDSAEEVTKTEVKEDENEQDN